MNKGTAHHNGRFRSLFDHFRERAAGTTAGTPGGVALLDLPLDRASLEGTPPPQPHAPRTDARSLKAAMNLLARAIDAARMT